MCYIYIHIYISVIIIITNFKCVYNSYGGPGDDELIGGGMYYITNMCIIDIYMYMYRHIYMYMCMSAHMYIYMYVRLSLVHMQLHFIGQRKVRSINVFEFRFGSHICIMNIYTYVFM